MATDEIQTAESPADSVSGDLSPTERAEAQRYGRVSLVLALADMALDVVYLGIMAFVFARPIDAWLSGLRRCFPASSRFCGCWRCSAWWSASTFCVSLPLSFYSGFVVEHQFKLSNQSLGRWVTTWLKRNAFGIVLGVVLYAGLYWMIWHTGN